MRLSNNKWVRYQFFKIKSTEGDDKTKVVHRNLLLPLFSDPSDHTSELDTESVVYQTVSTHEILAAGAVTSHAEHGCLW